MNTYSIMYKTDTEVQEPRNSVRKDPTESNSAVGIGEPNVSVRKRGGGVGQISKPRHFHFRLRMSYCRECTI